MDETYHIDDELPADDTSPLWATITQVSALLGIPRNTVRSAVRRAAKNGELWVKKEISDDGSMPVYLIDTGHPSYQAHVERWKHHTALRVELYEALEPEREHWRGAESSRRPARWLPSRFSVQPDTLMEPLSTNLHALPALCQWLYSHDLQIFTNTLAEEGQERCWQWRWENLHGEGYESSEAALVAAMQSWFDRKKRGEGIEENRQTGGNQGQPLSSPAPYGATEEFPLSWLFGRRNDSRMS